MPEPAPHLTPRTARTAAMLGFAAIFVLFAMLSRCVGPSASPATVDAFLTLLTSLALPLAWLAASVGFGWPLRRWLARESEHPVAIQVTLGIAALLFLDAGLGSLGWLTHRGVAIGLIVAGVALLIAQLARLKRMSIEGVLPALPAWAAAPAIAVLLIAACSAPGWLWSSEFGGYDALSYHLQLPKEWLALGRISPLEHNVYSFLPGYIEAAYLHLMAVRGDALSAVYDCQMLHAILTVVSAALVGTLVRRFAGSAFGAFAAAIYLATPWNIVVGSLAYNEMAVNVMLAVGLLAAFDERLTPMRRGTIIGIVSAAAVGAKLTSLGFVAAPLAILLIMRSRPRAWMISLAVAAIVGSIGIAPYLIRNAIHCGNPLFPFASELLGTAHWNDARLAAWQRGHISDASIGQRFAELWRQFFAYGFGSPSTTGEPWSPQWSILPWLGTLGALLAIVRNRIRKPAIALLVVMGAQIAFWLFATHLKSRFLIPAAIPLAALTAIGVHALNSRPPVMNDTRLRSTIVLGLVAFLLSILPIRIYLREGQGSPALAVNTASQQSGDALDDSDRRELGSTVHPAIAVNWLLPPGSNVLFVGESAPLYCRLDRITYNTVWDRNPLGLILQDHADDPEAVRQTLRSQGFTHVLVNPTMLTIWEREGWNDPNITRRRVQECLESAAEPVFDFPKPSEITIYALPE